MAYYEDLSACNYFPWKNELIAIGWLDTAHDFPKGAAPPEFFRKLLQLLVEPWQPVRFMGFHPCEFCGPSLLEFGAIKVEMGSSNLFIPSNRDVYVAPSLIVHYIDTHRYLPPLAFREAVLSCPLMSSPEFLAAVRATGRDFTPPGLRGKAPGAGLL